MAAYTLGNTALGITVNSAGAELCSLKAGDSELVWQGKKDVWPRHAPVLFPVVGKLKNDASYYNGNEIKLTQHGFARDREFKLIEQNESSLEFELTADEETLRIFPFHFSLIIRYQLQGSTLNISYKVFNPNNSVLLFSIGAHPGFNCKRTPGETLGDFTLEFEHDSLTTEKLENGLQSGLTYNIPLKNKKLALSSPLFDNDAIVLKNNQVNSVTLFSSKSGAAIRMNCKDWPYFGIWSKKGSDEFVCLEPWHGITDAVSSAGDFSAKEGIIHLEPNKQFEASYSIEVIQKR